MVGSGDEHIGAVREGGVELAARLQPDEEDHDVKPEVEEKVDDFHVLHEAEVLVVAGRLRTVHGVKSDTEI